MPFDYRKEYHRYKKYYFKKLGGLYQQPITQASLSLILSLVTASFFAFFALKPTLVTIASLLAEIKARKEVKQKLEQKVFALEKSQLSFAKAKESIPFIDKALPQTADFLRFEREVEFLVFKNDLVLADARFGQFDLFGKKTGQETTILTFRITLSGSFENLKNFLVDLENLDRLVVLDKVSFTKKTEIKGAELQIDLSGKVFYFPNKNGSKENSNR